MLALEIAHHCGRDEWGLMSLSTSYIKSQQGTRRKNPFP